MRSIVLEPQAARELDRLPADVRLVIEQGLSRLSISGPYGLDIKRLKGAPYLRLRIGATSTADSRIMGKPVKIYTDEAGERMVVLREQDYMDLLARQFPEEDEDIRPEFIELLKERDASLAAGNYVILDPGSASRT